MSFCLQRMCTVRVPKHFLNRIVNKDSVIRRPYYFPPSQYDHPIPQNLYPWKVHKTNKEVLPILYVTLFAMLMGCAFWTYFIFNKMDVVYASHNRDNNLSRTMNLCNPKIYKLITLDCYDMYEPWPEMQRVLDKMKHAEQELALNENKNCFK